MTSHGMRVKRLPSKFDRRQTLKDDLKHKPAKYRIVFAASVVCSQREIARVMGRSVGWVNWVLRSFNAR